MSEEEDIPITYKPGTLSGKSESSVDKADAQEYSESLLGRNFIERATEVAKDRRYVNDPSDAPDDADVEEGPQGGHYYEIGSNEEGGNGDGEAVDSGDSSDGMGDRDISDMSDEELEDYADYLWDQHESFREARGGQGGRSTDTQMDEGMKDTLESLREIDEELRSRESGGEEESVEPEELWQSPEVVFEELRDEELEEYEDYLRDLHEEASQEYDETGSDEADERMREVMDELREVDSEQLSRGDEKGADPKDEDVEEAAEYLAQELGGDVEPGDVVDAVQTDHRVQPDDEE